MRLVTDARPKTSDLKGLRRGEGNNGWCLCFQFLVPRVRFLACAIFTSGNDVLINGTSMDNVDTENVDEAHLVLGGAVAE